MYFEITTISLLSMGHFKDNDHRSDKVQSTKFRYLKGFLRIFFSGSKKIAKMYLKVLSYYIIYFSVLDEREPRVQSDRLPQIFIQSKFPLAWSIIVRDFES